MKERNAHDALMALVAKLGTQHAAAQFLGITDSYMCDLVKQRRDISDRLLLKLGLRRMVVTAKVA